MTVQKIFKTGNINIDDDIIQKVKGLPYIQKSHYNAEEFTRQGYPLTLLNQFRAFSDVEMEQHSDIDFSWTNVLKPNDWQKIGLLFMKALPAYCIPPHCDHFHFYSKHYGVDTSQIVRRLLFVEDWSDGHYFQVGDHICTKWKSGDWIEWGKDDLHLGGNFGPKTRYTVQITGLPK